LPAPRAVCGWLSGCGSHPWPGHFMMQELPIPFSMIPTFALPGSRRMSSSGTIGWKMAESLLPYFPSIRFCVIKFLFLSPMRQ